MDGRVKYEYHVDPGADPTQIGINVEGHTALCIDDDGSLEILTGVGNIRDSPPSAFYDDDGQDAIPCKFVLNGSDSYTIALGTYDDKRPVIIDPLLFSTLLFNYNQEVSSLNGLSVGDDGRSYIIGDTGYNGLPTTPGVLDMTLSGEYDAYIACVNSEGTQLLWATFLGGSDWDHVESIALNPDGDIVLVGTTNSTDFPTTPSAFQNTVVNSSAFITILYKDGSRLLYSTTLDGSGIDRGYYLGLDAIGEIVIAGFTSSTDIPTTPGAYKPYPSEAGTGWFVSKLSANLSTLLYSTYYNFGDFYSPVILAFTVDSAGRAYLLVSRHYSWSRWTELQIVQFMSIKAPHPLTLEVNGSVTVNPSCMVTSSSRYVYVVGQTDCADLPVSENAISSTWSERSEMFLCKFDISLGEIAYLTYLGFYACPTAVVSAGDETILISGLTDSHSFNATPGAFDTERTGFDSFVSWIDTKNPRFIYSTLIESDYSEPNVYVGRDRAGNAYVAGSTTSIDTPTTPGAYRRGNGSEPDAIFLCAIPHWHMARPRAIPPSDLVMDQHVGIILDGSRSTDDEGVVSWTWNFTFAGEEVTLSGPSHFFVFDDVGTYYVTLNVTDAHGNWDTDVWVVTIRDSTLPVAVASDITVPEGVEAELNGSASTDNVGVVNWTWLTGHPGQWTFLYGPVVNYTFPSIGVHAVRLRVTDLAGNMAELRVRVTVTDATPPLADAGPDRWADQHDSLGFDGGASTDNIGVVGWHWDFVYDGQEIVLERSHPSFIFDIAGIYDLCLTVWDAAGNFATDDIVLTIRDTTPPVADAGLDREAPQHSVVTLDGTGSIDNVAVVGWTWSFSYNGNDMEFRVPIPTFRFDLAGTYAVRLTVRDAEGYSSWDLMEISVIDIEPPVAVAGGNITVEWGSTVIFDGTGSRDNVGVQNLTWSFAYGKVTRYLHGWTRDFTFSREGNYTIILTVADAAGNTDSTTMRVDVRPKPSSEEPQEHWWLWPSIIALVLVVMTVVRLLQLYDVPRRKR